MTAQAIYPRVAVVGCGLIGGSIVRAARAHGLAGEVVVAEVDAGFRARLAQLGVADRLTADPVEAVEGADLVILATPPAAIGELARRVGPAMKPGATLTDVGSVKGAVGDAMAAAAPDGVFVVPGHPIAGTELSGPDAGFAELFRNRWTILCPRRSAAPGYGEAVERLSAFWEAMGARVECMDETHHDMVLAVTSHLPHLIAYTIVGTAAELEEVSEGEVMKFSAGGFRDFTRIASSDPIMWRDIFLLNSGSVLEVLELFQRDLAELTKAMRAADGAKLQAHFTRTRAIRRGVIAAGQESPAPNFGRDKPPTG
jgi:cyclohexadieny/prephenate dehydrogenase